MSIPERETDMLWVRRWVPVAGSERKPLSAGRGQAQPAGQLEQQCASRLPRRR